MIYTKNVEEERAVFSSDSNIPTSTDPEVTFKNASGAPVGLTATTQLRDDGRGGMFIEGQVGNITGEANGVTVIPQQRAFNTVNVDKLTTKETIEKREAAVKESTATVKPVETLEITEEFTKAEPAPEAEEFTEAEPQAEAEDIVIDDVILDK